MMYSAIEGVKYKYIEGQERSGRPKVYEDAELKALLDQDSFQTQEE